MRISPQEMYDLVVYQAGAVEGRRPDLCGLLEGVVRGDRVRGRSVHGRADDLQRSGGPDPGAGIDREVDAVGGRARLLDPVGDHTGDVDLLQVARAHLDQDGLLAGLGEAGAILGQQLIGGEPSLSPAVAALTVCG